MLLCHSGSFPPTLRGSGVTPLPLPNHLHTQLQQYYTYTPVNCLILSVTLDQPRSAWTMWPGTVFYSATFFFGDFQVWPKHPPVWTWYHQTITHFSSSEKPDVVQKNSAGFWCISFIKKSRHSGYSNHCIPEITTFSCCNIYCTIQLNKWQRRQTTYITWTFCFGFERIF